VTFSPWHLLGLGLLSLIGTGVVAAIERSQERAAAAQAEARAPQTIVTAAALERPPEPPRAAVAPAAQAPTHTPSASRAGAPPPSSTQSANVAPPAAAQPVRTAGDPGRPAALFLTPPVQAAAPVAARPAQPSSERKQATGDGPLVTASLTPATPATTPAPAPPSRPALAPAPTSAGAAALKASAAAPTDCLPSELRAVLTDVAARFGQVTVVSTHRLNTVNHSAGSIREKLHHDCKAVDISVDRSRIEEIKAYLKGRREIGGLESYRNGVIHMDVSGASVASTRVRPGMTTRRTSVAEVPADALQAPAASTQAVPVLPALPDRASGGDN
jgi:hypothetical protein